MPSKIAKSAGEVLREAASNQNQGGQDDPQQHPYFESAHLKGPSMNSPTRSDSTVYISSSFNSPRRNDDPRTISPPLSPLRQSIPLLTPSKTFSGDSLVPSFTSDQQEERTSRPSTPPLTPSPPPSLSFPLSLDSTLKKEADSKAIRSRPAGLKIHTAGEELNTTNMFAISPGASSPGVGETSGPSSGRNSPQFHARKSNEPQSTFGNGYVQAPSPVNTPRIHTVSTHQAPSSPVLTGRKRAKSPDTAKFPPPESYKDDSRRPYQEPSSPSTHYLDSDDKLDKLSQTLLNKTRRLSESLSVHGLKRLGDSEIYWLGLYFLFNLGLTLYNKLALNRFPFPWTLTGIHAASGCIGCVVAQRRGYFTPQALTQRAYLILISFSVLYTINIAVSNISLQLVTVPFHQVVRASTPVFTIATSWILYRDRVQDKRKIICLIPVIAGVGFATYGDYHFTFLGLILTLLGTILASLKTVTTNTLQTRTLSLQPLDLLYRMSPLALAQCMLYAWMSGESKRVMQWEGWSLGSFTGLTLNAAMAFGLNVVSFTTNKKVGALTMTVAANIKQVLTILLSVLIFNLSISGLNLLGILLTLIGGAAFAYVEFNEKQSRVHKRESSSLLPLPTSVGKRRQTVL